MNFVLCSTCNKIDAFATVHDMTVGLVHRCRLACMTLLLAFACLQLPGQARAFELDAPSGRADLHGVSEDGLGVPVEEGGAWAAGQDIPDDGYPLPPFVWSVSAVDPTHARTTAILAAGALPDTLLRPPWA